MIPTRPSQFDKNEKNKRQIKFARLILSSISLIWLTITFYTLKVCIVLSYSIFAIWAHLSLWNKIHHTLVALLPIFILILGWWLIGKPFRFVLNRWIVSR